MLEEQVYIHKNVQEVWNFIEAQFCAAYSCSKKELNRKEIEFQTYNFMSQPIKVKQRIVAMVPNEIISMETISSRDVVVTTYRLEADGDFTLVALQEEGKGKGSKLRTWNYWLMSFPLFRRGSQKKLKKKLIGLRLALQTEAGSQI